jgi:hypothetical protein
MRRVLAKRLCGRLDYSHREGNKYNVGLRFSWGRGHVLLSSLLIEEWPVQSDWDREPDHLNAFVRLVDSLVLERSPQSEQCSCLGPWWWELGQRLQSLF